MNRSFCFAFLRSRLLAWSSWNTEDFNFWTLQYYWGETSEILLFVLVTIRSERRVFLGSSHTSHKVELKKEDWPFFFICVESKDNSISSLHFGKPEKGESLVISKSNKCSFRSQSPCLRTILVTGSLPLENLTQMHFIVFEWLVRFYQRWFHSIPWSKEWTVALCIHTQTLKQRVLISCFAMQKCIQHLFVVRASNREQRLMAGRLSRR